LIKLIIVVIFFFFLQGCLAYTVIQGVAALGWGYYQNEKVEEIKEKLEEKSEEVKKEEIQQP